eukprot:Gregarina_sp_Pseudo_9__5921@NODE_944_length_2044_cov_5_729177_g885_i0_p1_GENE_NODE_944_length_2044_cov_5_729177_g885_i0NODE_944_length_2044_cov_5_729177_g885_i0_p1_ORF_typecomplete_len616_score124_55CDC27/PF09507_10/89CDC27/PF09507_10/3_5_NODE_944_length_2044_cov_5_729177_g885_i01562003
MTQDDEHVTFEVVASPPPPPDSVALEQAVLEGKAFLIERPIQKPSRRCGCVAFNRPSLEDYVAPFMSPQCTWAQRPLRQLPLIPAFGPLPLEQEEEEVATEAIVPPPPVPPPPSPPALPQIQPPPYKLQTPTLIRLVLVLFVLWSVRQLHVWWIAKQSQLRFERLLESASFKDLAPKKSSVSANGRKKAALKKETVANPRSQVWAEWVASLEAGARVSCAHTHAFISGACRHARAFLGHCRQEAVSFLNASLQQLSCARRHTRPQVPESPRAASAKPPLAKPPPTPRTDAKALPAKTEAAAAKPASTALPQKENAKINQPLKEQFCLTSKAARPAKPQFENPQADGVSVPAGPRLERRRLCKLQATVVCIEDSSDEQLPVDRGTQTDAVKSVATGTLTDEPPKAVATLTRSVQTTPIVPSRRPLSIYRSAEVRTEAVAQVWAHFKMGRRRHRHRHTSHLKFRGSQRLEMLLAAEDDWSSSAGYPTGYHPKGTALAPPDFGAALYRSPESLATRANTPVGIWDTDKQDDTGKASLEPPPGFERIQLAPTPAAGGTPKLANSNQAMLREPFHFPSTGFVPSGLTADLFPAAGRLVARPFHSKLGRVEPGSLHGDKNH